MRKHRVSISLFITWVLVLTVVAGEVRVVTWDTDHAAVPAKLDEKQKNLFGIIRLGVSVVPEPKVMEFTFLGGSALGLSPEQARSLQSLLVNRYKKIEADERFSRLPSALPYCFSAKKPGNGLASVYVPDLVTGKTNVILFLHGFGGSFIYYQHYLASIFPDHVIICPAYGVSCSHISSVYLEECVEAVRKDVKVEFKKPVLMGLSAGGFGGFREYARRPGSYAGFICLAAFPPKDVIPVSPRDGRIRVVAGGDEVFVKNGMLGRAEDRLKRRTADYVSHLIADSGHFFMLSAEEATTVVLRKWNETLQGER
ncbi:MAG: alpha/beta fold hydrolase [Akkermansiaceae bacterium]